MHIKIWFENGEIEVLEDVSKTKIVNQTLQVYKDMECEDIPLEEIKQLNHHRG